MNKLPEDRELALLIAEEMKNKKAENIVLLNPGIEQAITDYFMICEGDNTVHTKAIANAILTEMRQKHNVTAFCKEGLSDGRWILLDYGDVIVNIMHPESRELYKLEELWEDCKPEEL